MGTDGTARFLDHHGRGYTVEGDLGRTVVRGTRTRIWIKAFNRHGQTTLTRWIRFDLHTAREFHEALGHAINEAVASEVLFDHAIDRLDGTTGLPDRDTYDDQRDW